MPKVTSLSLKEITAIFICPHILGIRRYSTCGLLMNFISVKATKVDAGTVTKKSKDRVLYSAKIPRKLNGKEAHLFIVILSKKLIDANISRTNATAAPTTTVVRRMSVIGHSLHC